MCNLILCYEVEEEMMMDEKEVKLLAYRLRGGVEVK